MMSRLAVAEDSVVAQLTALEKRSGGRLGVAAFDTATGKRIGHRADERFPMCSTFKILAVGALLTRVDRGQEHLDRVAPYTKSDLVTYSPITEKHAGAGMPLRDLCDAALRYSDNTAANLLLKAIGGPPAVTAFARTLGDKTTRLDRWETALNEALPGDPRDTTTPAAMLVDLRKLALGTVLSQKSRTLLTGWMLRNTTGDARIRAGVPQDWKVADKTGSGERGTANDVAIVWPPQRAPVLIAVYLTGATSDAERNPAIAAAARAVTEQ
jgi:beta-lactamase class A